MPTLILLKPSQFSLTSLSLFIAMPKSSTDAKSADNRSVYSFDYSFRIIRFNSVFCFSSIHLLDKILMIHVRFVLILFVRLNYKVKVAAMGRKKSKKTSTDPLKPRRPPSAFLVFMYVLMRNIFRICCECRFVIVLDRVFHFFLYFLFIYDCRSEFRVKFSNSNRGNGVSVVTCLI